MKKEVAKYESLKPLQMNLIWKGKVLDNNILRQMLIETTTEPTTGTSVLHLSGGTQIFVEDKLHAREIVLTVDPGDTIRDVIKQVILRWGGYNYLLTRSHMILFEQTVDHYNLQSLQTLYSTEIVTHEDDDQ